MASIEWTHSICGTCWPSFSRKIHDGKVVEPFRIKSPEDNWSPNERCCFCMGFHCSGIYVRANGTTLACCGVHKGYNSRPAGSEAR